MPTYEYLCSNCGKRYDKREGFDALARQRCQFCKKLTAQRVLYAPPVVFKGGGFYKTDSREKSSTKAEPAAATTTTASTNGDSSSKGDPPSGDAPATKPATPAKKDASTSEAAAAS